MQEPITREEFHVWKHNRVTIQMYELLQKAVSDMEEYLKGGEFFKDSKPIERAAWAMGVKEGLIAALEYQPLEMESE